MRGKGYVWRLKGTFNRITPAYAGKSSLQAAVCRRCRDHPRLCGEKPLLYGRKQYQQGSPPPMRGKGTVATAKLLFHQDHPRLCGEKVYRFCFSWLEAGSPPPMRGKAAERKSTESANGITPAYAGKRRCWYACEEFPQDHPRLCGEKIGIGCRSVKVIGSPPPMRGKATTQKNFADQKKDHPRLCGEKASRFRCWQYR